MHINQPQEGFFNSERAIHELEVLLDTSSLDALSKPCQGCKKAMTDYSDCSPKCESAAAMLSSDPEKFPIEEHVLALVFEFSKLKVIQPCWSCEGHLNMDGKLWRLPQAAFYSSSQIYPQLISYYLNDLLFTKKISYPWLLSITSYGGADEVTTYSLEPRISIDTEYRLDILQQDLLVIGDDFSDNIKKLAGMMLKRIKKT